MSNRSLVSTVTFSMPGAIPDEVRREGQRRMEEELQRLKQRLEA